MHLIKKGGNYGWSVNEGTHPFRPERQAGPTPILPPVIEHPHSEFRSLTGGYVYHGNRLKDYAAAYVYGDFDTGRVWALRRLLDGKKVQKIEAMELARHGAAHRQLRRGPGRRAVLPRLRRRRIHRLAAAEKQPDAPPFPRKLSETGLFASTKELKPAPGLIPYSVNAQLWSDGATKERYLALPGTSQIDFDTVVYPYATSTPAPRAAGASPTAPSLVKTFSLDWRPATPTRPAPPGDAASRTSKSARHRGVRRRLLARLHLRLERRADRRRARRQGRHGPHVHDQGRRPGERKQTWHFPSRAECILCHTMPAKYALGVNTLQMNKDHDYGGGRVANQLRTLDHLGLFKEPLPEPPEKLPRLANYAGQSATGRGAARAYLHANCTHCHMKWGGGNAEFQLLATMDLKATKVLTDPPRQGKFDLKEPGLVVPGSPERSMLLYRMKRLDAPRMPRVASSVVDDEGVKLVEEWIKGMK